MSFPLLKYLQEGLTALCLLCLLAACTPDLPQNATDTGTSPRIFPDYADVTIPYNIAPLRFEMAEPVEEAIATIENGTDRMVTQANGDGQFLFDESDWAQLLSASNGRQLSVTVYARQKGRWVRYKPFLWEVSPDAIDSHLAYRLIEPGYVVWNKMGIYQRDLTGYSQKAIVENSRLDNNCMNCHSFNQRRPDQMMLHMRAKTEGTYLTRNGQIERVNGKVNDRIQSLVYPYWHPSGRFIAFSSNTTRQAFHLNSPNRIEVYDLKSDIVVYDIERHEVLTDSSICSSKAFETFPTFSPDGRTLYFCTAEAKPMPGNYKEVKYSLCAVSFDAKRRTFGQRVDTLFNSRTEGKSASFPRVSPDGRFLVFTAASYGNFSIWHKDADLYLLDLATRTVRPLNEANSPDVESYHSWSGNGRWLVFSSRRMNGLYTRPYFTHIDRKGHASKPFVLPQASPSFYRTFMYSYNIPELVSGEVETDQQDWVRATRDTPTSISMAGAR